MSWMDSWSRPAKSQATPAPYYLLPGGEATPYCHACGRVIGQRKQVHGQLNQHNKGGDNTEGAVGSGTAVKYCSSRCRGRKPGKLDREIEGVFVRFLLGEEVAGKDGDGKDEAAATAGAAEADVKDFGWAADKPKQSSKGNKHQQRNNKKIKGDARILVSCSMVEDAVFAHHREQEEGGDEDDGDPEEQRPGTSSSKGSSQEDDTADEHHPSQEHHPQKEQSLPHDALSLHPPSHNANEDLDPDVQARLSVRSGTRIRPPQSVSQVNGSVGGEKGRAERADETAESLRKRRAGQRRAREREMVRCAARRGWRSGSRFCEAVMSGKVVEPSFAKGNWSIRWREE
ncbi:hypothetical protein PG985_011527 [Apiospora marii]|uniref:uncharacterized protein n=1 Tax=Apiospora marii TaxID=335849 RepID=UPI0031308DAC